MKVELDDRTIEKLAIAIVKAINGEKKKMLTPSEKARELGISKSRLYKIKDTLDYIKLPNGRLRFSS